MIFRKSDADTHPIALATLCCRYPRSGDDSNSLGPRKSSLGTYALSSHVHRLVDCSCLRHSRNNRRHQRWSTIWFIFEIQQLNILVSLSLAVLIDKTLTAAESYLIFRLVYFPASMRPPLFCWQHDQSPGQNRKPGPIRESSLMDVKFS